MQEENAEEKRKEGTEKSCSEKELHCFRGVGSILYCHCSFYINFVQTVCVWKGARLAQS